MFVLQRKWKLSINAMISYFKIYTSEHKKCILFNLQTIIVKRNTYFRWIIFDNNFYNNNHIIFVKIKLLTHKTLLKLTCQYLWIMIYRWFQLWGNGKKSNTKQFNLFKTLPSELWILINVPSCLWNVTL